jgi:peroxiredoxin
MTQILNNFVSLRETKDQTNVPKLDLTTSEESEESPSKKEKDQSREVPVDTTRERPSTGFESGTVPNLSTEGSNLMQKRISSSAESSSVKPGSLRAELEAEVRRIKESFSRGNRRQLTAEIDALKRVRITKGVLQVGEFVPSFRLRAQNGRMISSKQLLQNGPLIVSFYHGYWSSLCMIELRALQRFLHRFQARGAMVVAISPDAPTNAERSMKKSGAKFPLLSDKENSVARKFRLLYQMDASFQVPSLTHGLFLWLRRM